jgi:two-component system CheB/CheR fusion protein
MPVDFFLRSLARDKGERAGCVILSGTGTDGTHGLRAIKEHGGLTMVQNPDSARHKGMPNSAIDTGLVDYQLAPTEMPQKLLEYFEKPPSERIAAGRKKKEPDAYRRILSFLANRTRHDFSQYKNGTLSRRIARRMVVTRCDDVSEYLRVLNRDENEIRALFQDLLIGVTNFFRDPEAFAYLKENVLPDLISQKPESDTLRVWVPGCATGEEAYSVAMVLVECMEENDAFLDLQIFGTDIDAQAIEKARQGKYLQNIASDLGLDRLKRFFSKEGNRYLVKREIREQVVFAEQNILRDPPFSELDLLVCRNLLIYLKTEAQDRLVPLFHYTLKKDGILFLGTSETIGRFSEMFETVSKKHSVYRKKETVQRPHVHFPTGRPGLRAPNDTDDAGRTAEEAEPVDLDTAVETVLMEEFIPPCVIVNPNGEILLTRGRTGRYLELAQGKPNLNIADLAREGLRFSLLSALRKARDGKETVRERAVRVKTNSDYQWIDLIVKGFDQEQWKDYLMVVFDEIPPPAEEAESPRETAGDGKEDRVEALEKELMRVRQDYRSAMEELETSNEELRSSNEEMQSANEELQSTNEELESSREELQSLNEELNTVNSELQHKMEELDETHRAFTEVLNNTRIAMVFLDNELCVSRFTDEATKLINLIDSDAGRPLEHISTNLNYDDLFGKVKQVHKNLTPFEDEVQTEDGHWYRMNIMCQRNMNHGIEGVVLTFVNIDAQKSAQQEIEDLNLRSLQSARQFTDSIIDTIRESLLVLDEKFQVVRANRRFYDTFQVRPEDTEDKSLFELGDGQWDIPELRDRLKKVVAQRQAFEDYQVEHRFPEIGLKKMLLNGRHLQEADDNADRVLLAIEDITETDR